jgi:hypothetical protein
MVCEIDMNRLNTWEMKILRRIYGPVGEQGIWGIRTNQELRDTYKDLDIAGDIKKKNIGIYWTCKNESWKGI